MTKTLRLSIGLALMVGASSLFAQTATPSTTLCAAVTANATTICLTSTTSVVNQTGIYVDSEFMVVLLTQSQTLAASNAYVPVSRNNRSGATPPTPHANGAVAWLALTPDKTKVPGDNGFAYSTNLKQVGPCVLAGVVYLPIIWPDLGMMRTCGDTNGAGTGGQWVDYTIAMNQNKGPNTVQFLTTNAALPVATGNYLITKAGILSDTLAAPTAGVQDGIVITFASTTANAHVITCPSGIIENGATADRTSATLAAVPGASITLMSYNGKWYVLSFIGTVTYA